MSLSDLRYLRNLLAQGKFEEAIELINNLIIEKQTRRSNDFN